MDRLKRLIGWSAAPAPAASRRDRVMAAFRRDKFRRLLCAAVVGVLLAHYLDMTNTVLIGIFPASFLLTMDRFAFGDLFRRCAVLLAGLVAGTLVIEIFQSMPYMAALVTYGIFFTVLHRFSRGVGVGSAYSFTFTYCLATINGSYASSTMELAICEYYLFQAAAIFFLVWGCFALFPAEKPSAARSLPQMKNPPVSEPALAVHALIWLAIWLVFLLFEWRFALFAFLSFIGAFRYFERRKMKKIVGENMIVHTVSCAAVAFFSLLLFSLTGNFFVFLAGVLLLLIPFLHYAVYPPAPELAYRCNSMVSGVLVPLTLYVGTDHAALYQSSLRARLIVLLMLFLWLVIEFIYHTGNTLKFTRRVVKKTMGKRIRWS